MRILSVLSIVLTIVSASAEPFSYATLTQGGPALELKEGETALVIFKAGSYRDQLVYVPRNGAKVFISLLPTLPARESGSDTATASSDCPLPLAGPAKLSITDPRSSTNRVAIGLKIVKTNQEQSPPPKMRQSFRPVLPAAPAPRPAPAIQEIEPVADKAEGEATKDAPAKED